MKKLKNSIDFVFISLTFIVAFLIPSNGVFLNFYDPTIHFNLLRIPFILWVLFGFFTSTFSIKLALKSWVFKGFTVLFLWYFASLFYFSDGELKSIEIKLSFLIVPLLMFSNADVFKKYKNGLSISFLFGLFCTIILMDWRLFQHYKSFGSLLFYVDYSFVFHPTYIAMVILVAVLVLFDGYFKKSKRLFLQIATAILICFFVVHLFIILSKAVILVTLLGVLVLLIKNFISDKRGVLIFLLITCLPLIGLLFKENIRTNLLTTVNNRFLDLTDYNSESGSTSFRWKILKSAPEIIHENWILGFGSGNEEKILMEFYVKNDLTSAIFHQYNTHNQFFQTWLSLGVFGFILLLSLCLAPVFMLQGLSQKLIFASYIVVFFTEAMLERQFGIVLYLMVYCFIIINETIIKQPKKT